MCCSGRYHRWESPTWGRCLLRSPPGRLRPWCIRRSTNSNGMITIDALALGLFAVNGTSKALLYNTSGMTAVFLGTFTAMGGGVIRDMLVNEVPMVVRDPHLYVVPAVLGSIFTVWVWRAHTGRLIGDNTEMLLDVVIVLVVIVLRICSVKFNIRLPGAVQRHRVHLPATLLRERGRRRTPTGSVGKPHRFQGCPPRRGDPASS